jgi:hypothetical protein
MNRALLVILLTFLALAALNGCDDYHVINGVSPEPCTVSSNSSGAIITCPDGSTASVANGVDGLDGSVIEWVDPCPTIVVAYPELLMKVDGVLYAVYASGAKIHLVKLTPGTYATTDGRSCTFTINVNGELVP